LQAERTPTALELWTWKPHAHALSPRFRRRPQASTFTFPSLTTLAPLAVSLVQCYGVRFRAAPVVAGDEPLRRPVAVSEGNPYRVLTPRIGQPALLDEPGQRFTR
jgi:hypothetical protein